MPTFDFIGWAFTSLSRFNFFDHPGEKIVLPIIIIALSVYLTLWLFSTLHRMNDRRRELFLIFGLLAVVVLSNILYLQFSAEIWNRLDVGLFVISWYIINNFIFWAVAILLPAYFVYPEFREQNLRKGVALCFILAGIFRYGCEYLISFTPVSGLSYVYHEYGVIYPGYNLVMLFLTLGFAFVSYGILHGLIRRVPFVRKALGVA
jgi:hypothetical protein